MEDNKKSRSEANSLPPTASASVKPVSPLRAMASSHFARGAVDVVSPDIASLTLVTPLPFVARIYVGPWLVAYPLAAYAFYGDYDRYIRSIGMSQLELTGS